MSLKVIVIICHRLYSIDVRNSISDNISNNIISDKVPLNVIRNIVDMGSFNITYIIIGLIKSIKGLKLMKYNERLSRVTNTTINNTCNSLYSLIYIIIITVFNNNISIRNYKIISTTSLIQFTTMTQIQWL